MKTIDAIRIECACGERAKLPPELAGRRVRCTSCKAKIRVPGPRVDSERLGRTSDSSRQGQRSSRSGSRSGSRSSRSGSGSKRARSARSGSGSGSGSGRSGSSSKRSRTAQDAADRFTMPKRSMHTKASKKSAPAPARDRAGEAHIQAIGVWYRIYAVLCFALTAFLLRNLEGARVETMGAIAVGAGGFMWWLGSSLMNFERWARNVLGVCSALGLCYQFSLLLLLPTGEQLFQAVVATLWLVATLWVLFGASSANVFRDDYPALGHEPIRWASSPFFWLPIATSVGWFLIRVPGSLAVVTGQ